MPITAYTDANNRNPSTLLVTRLAGALMRSGRANDADKLLLDWLGKHADDMVATEQFAEINIATWQTSMPPRNRCRIAGA